MVEDKVMREFRALFGGNSKFDENIIFLDNIKYLMMCYESAIKEVRTKLEILSAEMELKSNRSPIEFIKTRVKKPKSIGEKLIAKKLPLTIDNMHNNLNDIAGIRVICAYVDDIYKLVEMLVVQDDINLIEMKDYIANPKKKGYRSLHIILEIPVFFSEKKHSFKVELQLRTIAMDYWASLEHSMRYKSTVSSDKLTKELEACAIKIANIETRMLNVRKEIDRNPLDKY